MTTNFNKILSRYNNNNFYMAPNLLKVMESTGQISVHNNSVYVGFVNDLFFPSEFDEESPILMDYEGYLPHSSATSINFGVEYIFDPMKVCKMVGKDYKPFKHNINVFSNQYQNMEYRIGEYQDIMDIFDEYISCEDCIKFNRNWYMQADMLQYKILYINNEPVAFNIWDESSKYIHYIVSYAIPMALSPTQKTKMYLDDYIQWLFYRDMAYNGPKKLVNAGGNFDNPDTHDEQMLKVPVDIRTRYSWNYDRN